MLEMTPNKSDVKYVKKKYFSILYSIEKAFFVLFSYQYFGINELNKSREFDIEAYSYRMKKEFPKKYEWIAITNHVLGNQQ